MAKLEPNAFASLFANAYQGRKQREENKVDRLERIRQFNADLQLRDTVAKLQEKHRQWQRDVYEKEQQDKMATPEEMTAYGLDYTAGISDKQAENLYNRKLENQQLDISRMNADAYRKSLELQAINTARDNDKYLTEKDLRDRAMKAGEQLRYLTDELSDFPILSVDEIKAGSTDPLLEFGGADKSERYQNYNIVSKSLAGLGMLSDLATGQKKKDPGYDQIDLRVMMQDPVLSAKLTNAYQTSKYLANTAEYFNIDNTQRGKLLRLNSLLESMMPPQQAEE